MPVEENAKDDRLIKTNTGGILLKSYGLPMIFWGYLLAFFMVLGFMALGIWGPLVKMTQGDDSINQILAQAVLGLILGLPIAALGFFFYEKHIHKDRTQLTVSHHVFGIRLKKDTYQLRETGSFALEHLLDSPNKASIEKTQGMEAFQNKGFFELFAIDKNNLKHLIDRNSRRGEMRKLKELLSRY